MCGICRFGVFVCVGLVVRTHTKRNRDDMKGPRSHESLVIASRGYVAAHSGSRSEGSVGVDGVEVDNEASFIDPIQACYVISTQ